MEYKDIMDMHVHTDNSFDGVHSAVFMCENAIERGVRAIAFTDHCELDSKTTNFKRTTTQTFFEIAMAKKAFEGKLYVLQGIEIGQAIFNLNVAEERLAALDYDFVLGAIHNLENEEDFYFMDYSKMEHAEVCKLLERYFLTIYKLVEWGGFDSLAHLTYPLRYIEGKYGIKIDMAQFDSIIEQILKLLVQKEKALEINTSGLRQAHNQFSPSAKYVKLFHELGGEYVTIGSDAHYAADIAKGVNEAMKMAVKSGFKSTTFFAKRMPMKIEIK